MYIARQTEFIIRRCFLPYALLAFAVLNIMHIAFIATAIGANLVWIIASYSYSVISSLHLSYPRRLQENNDINPSEAQV